MYFIYTVYALNAKSTKRYHGNKMFWTYAITFKNKHLSVSWRTFNVHSTKVLFFVCVGGEGSLNVSGSFKNCSLKGSSNVLLKKKEKFGTFILKGVATPQYSLYLGVPHNINTMVYEYTVVCGVGVEISMQKKKHFKLKKSVIIKNYPKSK